MKNIPFYIFVIVFIFGMILSYMTCVAFIKGKRGNAKELSKYYIFYMSFLFGSPMALFMYFLFPEIKDDDCSDHKLLILLLVLLVIHIIVIFLLFYFKVFVWESSSNDNASDSVSLIVHSI